MSTIGELGSFPARETAPAAATTPPVPNRTAGASIHMPTTKGTLALGDLERRSTAEAADRTVAEALELASSSWRRGSPSDSGAG